MQKSELFEKFCKESGFFLDEYQKNIVNRIFDFLESDLVVQIILMPNATGKTNLSHLLSCFFVQDGKKPLLYSPEGEKDEYMYLPHLKRNMTLFDQVQYSNFGEILSLKNNTYDCILSDGLAYSDISIVRKSEITNVLLELWDRDKKVSDTVKRGDFLPVMEWLGQRTLVRIAVNSRAKTIIFMKRSELPLCRKSPFIMSSKKEIVDVFPDEKPDDSDKLVEEAARGEESQQISPVCPAANIESIFERFQKHFDQRFDSIENKIDAVSDRITELHSIVQSIQIKTLSQKESLSTFADILDDEEMLDRMVDKIVLKLTQQIGEEIQQFEKTGAYRNHAKLVEARMGEEAWKKLTDESKRFLITAKFMFEENVILEDSVDYSSICLLASKAIEVELAKRFVKSYCKYLEERCGNQYSIWPSAVIKKDQDGALLPISESDYMLGNTPFILGFLPKKGNSAQYGSVAKLLISQL